jgi:hypothetical protein
MAPWDPTPIDWSSVLIPVALLATIAVAANFTRMFW